MSTAWLHGQRKPELLALADKVGLKNTVGLKKAELEERLDEFMRANKSTLAKDQSLQAYLRGAISGTSEVAKTPRRRTIAKVKDDVEDSSEADSSNKALITRSPRTSISLPKNVPLPPSPAVIVEKIDRQTAKVRSDIAKAWSKSGIVERTDSFRDQVSATVTIESLAILVELYGLRSEILPFKALTVIPAINALNTPDIPVMVPDLFVLLSSEFWVPFTLWLASSVLLPMLFSYVFNLSLKAKHGGIRHSRHVAPAAQYDPMSYNISKALTTWLLYDQGVRLGGWVNSESLGKIEAALPGGHQGLFVGAGIGILLSLYEAALRK